MTAKTMFSVKLPATGKTYDFWVPDDMRMQEAAILIARAMELAEPQFYSSSLNVALMYEPTGQIQNPAKHVGEIGFTDGDKFVLV